MRQAIGRVQRYVEGHTFASFTEDEKTIDAVLRCLVVVGEAARLVSREESERHPEIPWAEVRGLRNRVIHDYLGLDLAIVWEVATTYLADLDKALDSAQQTLRKVDDGP